MNNDLYLIRYGLVNPTIVVYNNNGKIERLETRRFNIEETVKIWRRGFNILSGTRLVLHCTKKDFNAMNNKADIAGCRSVRELLAEQGVDCFADDLPLFFKGYGD